MPTSDIIIPLPRHKSFACLVGNKGTGTYCTSPTKDHYEIKIIEMKRYIVVTFMDENNHLFTGIKATDEVGNFYQFVIGRELQDQEENDP